jgi:hypothetical protein
MDADEQLPPVGHLTTSTPRRFRYSTTYVSDVGDTSPGFTTGSSRSEDEAKSPETPTVSSRPPLPLSLLQDFTPTKCEHKTIKSERDDYLSKTSLRDTHRGDGTPTSQALKERQKLYDRENPVLGNWATILKSPTELIAVHTQNDSLYNIAIPGSPPSLRQTLDQQSATVGSNTSLLAAAQLTKPAPITKTLQELAQLLPPGLISRVTEIPNHCVSQTLGKAIHRCRHKQKLPDVDTSLIDGLRDGFDLDSRNDIVSALGYLRMLLPQLCCSGGSHLQKAEKALDEILSELKVGTRIKHTELEGKVKSWLQRLVAHGPKPTRSTAPTTACLDDFSGSTAAVETNTKTKASEPSLRRSRRLAGEKPETQPVKISYKSYFTTGSPGDRMTAPELLADVIARPLLKSEVSAGYLYFYWRKDNNKLVKIGYTAGPSVKKRLRRWEYTCGDDPVCATFVFDETLLLEVPVRNVRRLEALVHAELRQYRRREYGCRCGVVHKEWFEVDVGLVRKVIKKWKDWLNARPRYEDRVGGMLLEDALLDGDLKSLCTLTTLSVQHVNLTDMLRAANLTGLSATGTTKEAEHAGSQLQRPRIKQEVTGWKSYCDQRAGILAVPVAA